MYGHAMNTFPVIRLLMLDPDLLMINTDWLAGDTGMGSHVVSEGIICTAHPYQLEVMGNSQTADPAQCIHTGAVSTSGRGPRVWIGMSIIALVISVRTVASTCVVRIRDPRG